MTLLDFALNETESYIYRTYDHSHCSEHEPTREEVTLWRRVQELEAIIQNFRPLVVNELLASIPRGADKVWMNIKSMELLQRYALDVIQLEPTFGPERDNPEIWGSIRVLVDYDGIEEPHTTWLACDRNLLDGVISTERANSL
jgi:hypothetical protein